MNDEERLSQIQTCWREVWQAQRSGQRSVATPAQWALLDRYGGAAARYLLGVVRDPEVARELAQDFAVQFLDGGIRGVDPEKGRFRDSIKGVLRNLIRDHRRGNRLAQDVAAHPEPAFVEDPAADLDRSFLACWRTELMARCWQSLAQLEVQSGQPYHTILRFRTDHPDQSSDELAAALSKQLNREITAPGYRKALQRAREKFARALLDEVRESLPDPRPETVRQELIELDLYEYCRHVLDRNEGDANDS